MFVLPVLTATVPEAAADALRWRRSTLPVALDWARTLRLRGAAFAWRTIRGEECGGYWPAGTAAFHVNADIAVAAIRQVRWTGDADFDRECALPLLVETARLWHGLGYSGRDGRFHLDGVTGPDEYSALVDDNTYTNLMAAANLREAAAAARRWPAEAASGRRLDADEIAGWQRGRRGDGGALRRRAEMPEQDRGSTRRQRWDFAASAGAGRVSAAQHAPYFDLYRKQVVKQADLVLALHWCGERFSLAEKAAAFAYYEELTVRDSSLSACTQAVLAAEVGHLELAHAYLHEAALVDLQDREGRHRGRAAHGLAGRCVDRPGLRVRRAARPRRPAAVRAAAAGGHRAAGVRGVLARLLRTRRGHPRPRALRVDAPRTETGDRPPRPGRDARRRAAGAGHSGARPADRPADPAGGPRAEAGGRAGAQIVEQGREPLDGAHVDRSED